MANHVYNSDDAAVTLNGRIRVQIAICDDQGKPLFRVADHDLDPGDSITWTYPADGFRVEMS